MLECGPPLDPTSLTHFQHFAKGETPIVQTDVHIPKTEDFDRKKETLQRFVEGWDKFTCQLTNTFDKTTSECFGFLRLSLVDHVTLAKMRHLPEVRRLNKITPLWIENERDVLTYLRSRLQAISGEFPTQLWEDEMALEDMKEQGKVATEEYIAQEKRVRARILLNYWLEVTNIVENIFSMLNDKLDDSNIDLHFSSPESFRKFINSQAIAHKHYFGWDSTFSEKEFGELVESYFITQTEFFGMLSEEMEFVTEMRLKLAVKPQLGSRMKPAFSTISPSKARMAVSTATMSQHKLRRKVSAKDSEL